VLANAAESVETTFADRRLELEVDPAGDPAFVTGDARRARAGLRQPPDQRARRLARGRRRDVPPRAQQRLRARRGRRTAGAGVGTGTAQNAFRPFYTTKKSGGTGLGLAISRDIVRRHGGEIVLEARDGGGAEARVELPLPRRPCRESPRHRRRGGHPRRPRTLLSREGYDVAAAASAGEAIAMFDAESYDIVLLDLMLPDRPGLEVLREIRHRDPDAVVVIVDGVFLDRGRDRGDARRRVPLHPEALPERGGPPHPAQGLRGARLTEENRRLREELSQRYGLGRIVGKSSGMRKVFELVRLGGTVAIDDPRRGRERHRQGARRPGDPHALAALATCRS
jgi:hypothetical protein